MRHADAADHFPIRVVAEDEEMLHALRGLACAIEENGWKAAVAGTPWEPGRATTLRFTTAARRETFRFKATKLLSPRWAESA